MSIVDGKDVEITQQMFAEVFELHYEGVTRFLVPTRVMEAMKAEFSLTGTPFKHSSKKKR
ncbi:hypothetical protein F511_40087 [Dorcoceras hygrometricum]|uniref:Uncharacterized protein n=1 Tax=Dorcoceras hygrometricum TaxID=472368 RepID=A0A2Z7BQG0_9LAMI|nr:hypothetical protein F511_40087 [Dorcoceras hygrometricum]